MINTKVVIDTEALKMMYRIDDSVSRSSCTLILKINTGNSSIEKSEKYNLRFVKH